MDQFLFEKFYQEPKEPYNLISVVIFRMERSYASFSFYFSKLKRLVLQIQEFLYGFYLRIYYDDSIFHGPQSDEVKKLFEEYQTIPWVQLTKYSHPWFQSVHPPFHKGTFGTIVRMVPFFDDSKTRIILNGEVDVTDALLTAYRTMHHRFQKADSDYYIATSQCYYHNIRYEHSSEVMGIKQIPYAGVFWAKQKLPVFLFNRILNCLHESSMEKECDFINVFMRNISTMRSNKIIASQATEEDLFVYGFDEIFCGYIVKYLIENKIPYLVNLGPDVGIPLKRALLDHPELIDDPSFQKLFRHIMGRYYRNKETFEQNRKAYFHYMYTFLEITNKTRYRYLAQRTFRILMDMLKNKSYQKYKLRLSDLLCVKSHYNFLDIVTLICQGYQCSTI